MCALSSGKETSKCLQHQIALLVNIVQKLVFSLIGVIHHVKSCLECTLSVAFYAFRKRNSKMQILQ